MNVDFPHPDGPIMAVTVFSLNAIEISSKTFFWPKPALRSDTRIFSFKFDKSVAPWSVTGGLSRPVRSSALISVTDRGYWNERVI